MTEKIEDKPKTEEKIKVSPFISDDDIFEVAVNFYRENKKYIVEGVSEDFDAQKEKSTITLKIKYPSQADCDIIIEKARKSTGDFLNEKSEFDIRNFVKMEMFRFLALVRGWNVDRELNNKNITDLNPDIMRSILSKIRDEIGTNGII